MTQSRIRKDVVPGEKSIDSVADLEVGDVIQFDGVAEVVIFVDEDDDELVTLTEYGSAESFVSAIDNLDDGVYLGENRWFAGITAKEIFGEE